jgi:hypothetical protein
LACKQCAFLTFIPSAFFSPLKKMVPECIEWPKILSETGVSYADPREKGTRMPFWAVSFWERTYGMAFQLIPQQKYPSLCLFTFSHKFSKLL